MMVKFWNKRIYLNTTENYLESVRVCFKDMVPLMCATVNVNVVNTQLSDLLLEVL